MPDAAASPVPALHDAVQVRLLGLMVSDTYQWKHGWAHWRIRFHVDNDARDTCYAAIVAFVRDQLAPQCAHRVEPAEIVLYLADLRDARLVLRLHGAATQGPGVISALQSRASYDDAAGFAAELAADMRRGEDPDLPDLHWTVIGTGMTRVATTKAAGHTVVVRMGAASRQGLWVVSVDGREACAQFGARGDAMSKMGVAAALATFRAGRLLSAPVQAWR